MISWVAIRIFRGSIALEAVFPVDGVTAVLAIVVAMYVFTALGFELMQALPITASGGGGH